jgi:hypothetical protein
MKFRGHETFAIRKGWLNKGIKNIETNPGVFLGDGGNPMDVLGIGANMVKSLRYWMLATGLAEEPNFGHRVQTLTEVGRVIYNNDPYFEEAGSLALIHYNLAVNEQDATAWYIFYNQFDYNEFSEDDFQRNVKKYVRMNSDKSLPSERSVSDDYKCIINTYHSKQNNGVINPEDNIESPLTDLGLVEFLYAKNGDRVYKKVMIKENFLPDLIALAIIIKNANDERELKISSILKSDKCLGKAFNLDMIRVINILYRLEKLGYVRVIRTAGLDVVELLTEMSYIDCIREYYNTLNQN